MKNAFKFCFLRRSRCALLLALTIASRDFVTAALYQPGDIVTNLPFIARQQFTRPDGTVVPAGAEVHIKDFAGRVVFLEWFAVWCPYCVAAAPQVRTNISDWYAARGGNPYGVPVLHIAVNQESAYYYQTQTDSFAAQQGFNPIFNDYGVPGSNPVRFAFQTSGQPIFVVINCVTNSPSHQPWQVLVNYLGYGQRDFDATLAGFRSIINTVQPAIIAPQLNNPHRIGADFEFNFQTQPGRSYRVLSSTNFVSWTTLQTLNGSTNPSTFRHTNAPPASNFYRVVTP